MISSMLTAYAVHENNNISALRLKSSVKIYIWSLRNWWNLFRFFFFVLCAQWIFFKTLFKTYHFFFLSEIWLFEIPHLLAICILWYLIIPCQLVANVGITVWIHVNFHPLIFKYWHMSVLIMFLSGLLSIKAMV